MRQHVRHPTPTPYKGRPSQTLQQTLKPIILENFKPRKNMRSPVAPQNASSESSKQPAKNAQAVEEPHTPRNTHRKTLRKVSASERGKLNWHTDAYWTHFDIDNAEYKRQLTTQYHGYLDHLTAVIPGDTDTYKFKNKETKVFLDNGTQLSSLIQSKPGNIILSKSGTQKMNELAGSGLSEALYLKRFVNWLSTRRGGTRKRKQRVVKGGVSKKSYNNILYKRRRTFKRQ